MGGEKKIKNFREFWPFYMSQHSKRGTRFVHFVGTTIALSFIPVSIATHDRSWLLVGLFTVYGPAFLSHFIIEKNRPATFKHPFYSVGGDLKMWLYMLIGKIKI